MAQTQNNLIRTFLEGSADGVARASNMRVLPLSGSKQVLTGGRDGKELIFAIRRPLHSVTVAADRVQFFSRMRHSAVRSQKNTVRRIAYRVQEGDQSVSAPVEIDIDNDQSPLRVREQTEVREAHPDIDA